MARELHRRGILTKLRRSAGQDVEAGCGQLRARTLTPTLSRKREREPLRGQWLLREERGAIR